MCSTPNLLPARWVSWCATPMTVWCCVVRRRRPSTPWRRWEKSWCRWGCGCIRIRREWATCREGLDFLGCHFRARMSGRLWEQKRIVRYYLHRWPSQRAMARLRAKVRDRTGRNRVGLDVRDVIADLNPILRGWGNYFRTGNAADQFSQIDRYVVWRLFRLMVKKRGRNLRAGQADQWTTAWCRGHGLYKLSGTIRYPKAA